MNERTIPLPADDDDPMADISELMEQRLAAEVDAWYQGYAAAIDVMTAQRRCYARQKGFLDS